MNVLRAIFAVLVVTAVGMGAYVGLIVLTPATVWFNPTSVSIAQVAPGDVATVTVNRSIRFSFFGAYTVDVRDVETGLLACGRNGAHRYKGGLRGEYSLSLVEYAGDDMACAVLPDGVYTAESCWTVLYPIWGLLPPKTVCITSNPFRVTR